MLDVGCGNGLLTRDIALKAKEVIGIDINENHINEARLHCRDIGEERVRFIHADATTYNLGESFDKIVLSNILEHI